MKTCLIQCGKAAGKSPGFIKQSTFLINTEFTNFSLLILPVLVVAPQLLAPTHDPGENKWIKIPFFTILFPKTFFLEPISIHPLSSSTFLNE